MSSPSLLLPAQIHSHDFWRYRNLYVCMYDVCMSLRLIRASIHPPALVKTFRFLSFITQHVTFITLNNTDTCFEPEASYGQSGDVVVYDAIRHEMLF